MLADMEPAEMDERLAAERIEGNPLGRIAEILKLGFSALCHAWGSPFTPNHFEPDRSRVTRGSTRSTGKGATAEPVAASGDTSLVSPATASAIAGVILGSAGRRR